MTRRELRELHGDLAKFMVEDEEPDSGRTLADEWNDALAIARELREAGDPDWQRPLDELTKGKGAKFASGWSRRCA